MSMGYLGTTTSQTSTAQHKTAAAPRWAGFARTACGIAQGLNKVLQAVWQPILALLVTYTLQLFDSVASIVVALACSAAAMLAGLLVKLLLSAAVKLQQQASYAADSYQHAWQPSLCF